MRDQDSATTEKERWDRLYYPGSNTFINFFGERNGQTLKQLEGRITSAAAKVLAQSGLDGNLDLEHMRHIHRELFKSIYPWAGEIRDVNMSKRNEDSTQITRFTPPEKISELAPLLLQHAHSVLAMKERDFVRRPKDVHNEFTGHLAQAYQTANQMHPFREGNGRVHKLWLVALADRTGWDLDFNKIEPRAWNFAAAASAEGTIGGVTIPGKIDKLKTVFEHIATHHKAQFNPYIQGKLGNFASRERILEIGELSQIHVDQVRKL